MAHTPGPWTVNGGDTILCVNHSVAKVFHPESDARLIAAAPELLEALKEIAELTAPLVQEKDPLGMSIERLARETIAKAEGEERMGADLAKRGISGVRVYWWNGSPNGGASGEVVLRQRPSDKPLDVQLTGQIEALLANSNVSQIKINLLIEVERGV